jgi:alkanesulfonate monooxygenase SsuD/methylene tetrahydromethanopterin reductase-like flavin-dependent oxidoreductase (luciferase family)
VIDADGRIDRRYYELCTLWELRAAPRAGDVWVDGSRRYANPETYLISREHWPARRAEACRLTGTPEDRADRLRQRQAAIESSQDRLELGFPQNEYVRLVGDI